MIVVEQSFSQLASERVNQANRTRIRHSCWPQHGDNAFAVLVDVVGSGDQTVIVEHLVVGNLTANLDVDPIIW